jgi:hypothetical protein
MGAMRPQTPHRSPQQAFGGIHKVPAYGGIIKIAPVTLFSLPDYMPGIRRFSSGGRNPSNRVWYSPRWFTSIHILK